MILEIQQWLAGERNYEAGVAIVAKLSENAFLKKMLQAGPSVFNKQKLLQELTELNKDREAAPAPVTRTEIMTEEQYQQAPFEIKKKKQQATELNKLNGKRHAQLYTWIVEARKLFENDVEKINAYLKERDAGDINNMILDTDDELAKIYFEIDYFLIHKKLPDEIPDPALAFAEKFDLNQNLKNVRSRISKLNTKLKSLIPETEDFKLKTEQLAKEEKYRDDLIKSLNEPGKFS